MTRIGDLQSHPDRAAVRWFLRLQKGGLGPQETGEYQAWLSDSENASALKRVERLWGGVDQLANRPEIRELRERAVAKTIYTGRVALAIAACLLVVFAAAIVFTGRQDPARFMMALRNAAPEKGSFFTTIGQRSTVTLHDGSVLTLNTNSSAQVAYSASERKIILLRGQALFEVAKGQKRPFVVYAGDRRIVATGTAFDVRLGNSRVEVTMVEGHVIVDQPALASNRAARPNLELSAGQRLIASAGEPIAVTRTNVERVTSWTEGKLVFLDTGLSDAVAEANRYTETPIRLAEPGLSALRINGVFRVGQPAEFARAIAQIYPVSVEYQSDGAVTISSKASP
jgi:transmembrane sensor